MVYLDYSATTKADTEVIKTFVKANDFIGNPNSLHKLGVEAKNLIDASTKQIANLLGVKSSEIIYTSGASESNNLAIKGICKKYKNRGNHIITTELEHSSVYGPIDYLKNNGYIVDYVKLDNNGQVDLNNLEEMINDKTILVSINGVNSETGILQPIDKIASIVSKYPKCFFHSDMTQAIGKIKVNLSNIDLVSFSAHKFFGIKGIGVLIKKEKVELEPLIHGGKSTTIYRSGTPTTSLIASLAKALRLSLDNIDDKYNKVKKYNEYIKKELMKYEKVKINSNEYSIPHILNISILGVKPETMQHALEEYDVYVSTQSACANTNSKSKAVMAITNDIECASSSIRISISYKTTGEDIETFIQAFDKCYNKLTNLR